MTIPLQCQHVVDAYILKTEIFCNLIKVVIEMKSLNEKGLNLDLSKIQTLPLELASKVSGATAEYSTEPPPVPKS